MKKTIIIAVTIMLTGALQTGCGKYEDGPSFSLRTKKARLTNVWKVETMIASNGVQSTPNTEHLYEFDKNGTVTEREHSSTNVYDWQFNNNKGELKITSDSGSSFIWQILKLEHEAFWVKDTYGNEIHFVPN